MEVAVIEYSEEEDYSEVFIKKVSEQAATTNFHRKKANDLIDTLALARQMVMEEAEIDHVVLIAELDEEEKDKNNAFYQALAKLEADTGKSIFKLVFYAGDIDENELADLAEQFLDSVFQREKKPEEKKKIDEIEGEMGLFEGIEGPGVEDGEDIL